MLRFRLLYLFALLAPCVADANPVITEVMADNESTLPDEDGAFSDWIEVHNPTAAPIPLTGWYLTDKSSNATLWQFPAVTLAPGEFLIVWASGKNRRIPGAPLHTNFSLSKDGEFLALVRPDGATAQQVFSPKLPSLGADESYGSRFQRTTLVGQGATGRHRGPTTGTSTSWMNRTFTETIWSDGKSGYGFGITVPGINVRQVSKNGFIEGLADAVALLARPQGDPLVLSSSSTVAETLNLLGEGADGHYGFNQVPPGGGGENYVVEATGFIQIPTAGTYTFGLNSDDGGRIVINGTTVMEDDSFHGPEDRFGSVTLAAGTHSFQAVMFEGGGGDGVEFFAAPGNLTSFDAAVFRLVGDVANGGLAATTVPTASGGWIGTDVSSAMSGKTSLFVRTPFPSTGPGAATSLYLLTRFSDGYAAWLNASSTNNAPVSTFNAPSTLVWTSAATASRDSAQTLRRHPVNLTSRLPTLINGTNVLAVQGMRTATTDTSMLILPELVMGNLDSAAAPAFYDGGLATPGWINGPPSSLGDVADTQFSVKRGFFTAPITVTITSATPDAVIRYTTDGSTPDETHGILHTGPIPISSTTVLRARAMKDGWKSTDVDTHTYLFPNDVITQSANGSPPPGWPANSGTAQVLDHGMDPAIVNHPDPDIGGPATIKAALLALPTLSLTTDLPNLLNIGGSQGIYSNPYNRGFAWERPASLEWIDPPDTLNPAGTSAFQVNAGLRLRGGYSRSEENPKHSFRLFFREEYGEKKLRHPLFGRDGAREFDQIDLRTAQNYSWSFGGDDRNTFLREESCRQALLDMGQPGSHVRYVHLYLNGRYWGLYNLDERTEAAFSESYLGGLKEEYDVVKAEQEADYTIGATDGNLTAWQNLWNQSKAHRASPTNANYFRMMGLAADGTTPTADPVLLDPDNLIDYLLLTFWSGNLDGCVSDFLGNVRANNWYGSRRRVNNNREGFRFFAHDFEHTFLDNNIDRTGPFNSAEEAGFAYSNPLFLHQDLSANAEYRIRWADRVHRHLFNGGALTPGAWQNRINRLAASVDASIAAESARWGDAFVEPPRTRADWINAQNALLDSLPPRNAIVLDQLRADNLYPALDAPVLSPFGGHQPSGVEISITAPGGGTLYYMADGSDPRAVGGAVKPGALIHVPATTTEFLIPWSATSWRYLGTGSNQGTAWRATGFNDSTWPTGTAELGYGDGDEATTVPIVDVNTSTSGVQKAATCYFRRSFSVTNPTQITGLSLTVEYDDGYTVYLNGTRVAGTLPTNAAYNYYTGNAIEDTVETTAIPTNLLVSGNNVIAVEVHQAGSGSSDLSMNLSLTATRSNTPTPLFLTGTGPRTLKVRARSGTTWSAMAESVYQIGTVPPTAADLVVSEICHHPPDPHGDAEFIELLNTGSAILDLAGASFTEGIDFTFPAGTTLAPGGRILVVRDLAAFTALHGTGKPVAGVFANLTALSNSGERLRLESATGATLLDFTYGATHPWPTSAAGLGRSLVLARPSDPANPLSWRPSAGPNGNPGTGDSLVRAPGQSLLSYALADPRPAYDRSAALLSIRRRLGADAATLAPEWSPDCIQWFSHSLEFQSDLPDSSGNSVMTWKLDPPPARRAFLRVKVEEEP